MTPVKQDDDYNDFDALANDDIISSESDIESDDVVVTEDETGNTYGDYEAAARNKRKAIFNVVLVSMVLFGAIVAYLTFFKTTDSSPPVVPLSSNPTTAQDATAAAPMAAMEPTANPAAVPTNTALPPGVITPQDMVDATTAVSPSSNPVPPVPEPDNADDVVATSETSTTPVDGTMAEALPPPVTSTPTPNVDVVATPVAPVLPVAAVTPTDAAPVAAPAVMPATGETPMTPMAVQTPVTVPTTPVNAVAPIAENATSDQRLQQMEQQIQQLTAELSAAKANMNAVPVAATANVDNTAVIDQLRDLNSKFDRVTKQVDDLDQRTTGFAAELQSRANRPVEPTADAPVETKTPVQRKARVAKPAISKTPTAKWELRSAKPGEAWLGKLGTDEISHFAVGQTVPGLGVVQDVTQENNRWIIKTSNGTLRQ